jgi:hypothetical protein
MIWITLIMGFMGFLHLDILCSIALAMLVTSLIGLIFSVVFGFDSFELGPILSPLPQTNSLASVFFNYIHSCFRVSFNHWFNEFC